jgi:hypothetical protein
MKRKGGTANMPGTQRAFLIPLHLQKPKAGAILYSEMLAPDQTPVLAGIFFAHAFDSKFKYTNNRGAAKQWTPSGCGACSSV